MIRVAHTRINNQDYRGVRDQDGWETLELTVLSENQSLLARYILRILDEEVA